MSAVAGAIAVVNIVGKKHGAVCDKDSVNSYGAKVAAADLPDQKQQVTAAAVENAAWRMGAAGDWDKQQVRVFSNNSLFLSCGRETFFFRMS